MADDTDVLLRFCEEQWAQARQTENQRATITNLIIVIASVVIGFISQRGLTSQMYPLTVLLIVLGIFGAVVSEKLYERFHFHHDKVRYWRGRIDELHPNAQLLNLERSADDSHRNHHRVFGHIHLHHLWVVLHIAIAGIGIILTLMIVLVGV